MHGKYWVWGGYRPWTWYDTGSRVGLVGYTMLVGFGRTDTVYREFSDWITFII